ncbi:MAG: SoxR reducing system RseC family protein [Candidatus Cloacimonetes bacterium]|nr:SoxR reducing system RseC family protein [Candidatus Cloacimonadota bacterium]
MSYNEPEHDEIAVVHEVREGGVVIEIERGSGCDKCVVSGICMGKDRIARHFVPTDKSLRVGDRVRFEVSPVVRVAASLLLFLFPILMLVAFYLLARFAFGWNEEIAIVCSFAGLLASGFIIWRFDRKLGHKASFEIVDVLSGQEGESDENPSA